MVTTATDLQAALNRGGNIILGSDIGVEKTLTVAANSNLDLNGYKLSIVTRNNSAIQINIGQTLTIADNKYVSNSNPGNGKLYANGYRAGIQTSGATLIIEGGVVEAKGQWATGIGGIDRTGYSDGGTVIINDGTVSATGGCPGTLGGAGIGGMGAYPRASGNGGTITINGGIITATGGTYGAGIGGGGVASVANGGSGGTITINGGTVKAVAGARAYAIGGGSGSTGGGSLKATGGIIEFSNSGTDVSAPIFQNCTIKGDSAGEFKGTYNSEGKRISLNGASTWAQADIESAVRESLVPSTLLSDCTQPITRAEFCALGVALYETTTGKEITERKTFSDTSDINVQKMGALGIVNGVGNERFEPSGTLTREAAATILARLALAAGKPLPEQSTTFADKGKISSWAIKEVGQVQAAGIMNGIGENQFVPTGQYTREQSIITILRLFNVAKQ